jgi:hypothetical protein
MLNFPTPYPRQGWWICRVFPLQHQLGAFPPGAIPREGNTFGGYSLTNLKGKPPAETVEHNGGSHKVSVVRIAAKYMMPVKHNER